MSVTRLNPSDDIIRALREGLGPFVAPNDPLRGVLIGIQGERETLPMFKVRLEDVASGNWQRHEFIGWRFLAVHRGKPGIIVNVTARSAGHPPRVAAVQRSPYVAKTIEAVRAVPVPPTAEPIDVDLTLLNFPGLQTETYWIRSKAGDGWVVPYNTLIKELKAKSLYTLQEFFAVAKPAAERLLNQDDGL